MKPAHLIPTLGLALLVSYCGHDDKKEPTPKQRGEEKTLEDKNQPEPKVAAESSDEKSEQSNNSAIGKTEGNPNWQFASDFYNAKVLSFKGGSTNVEITKGTEVVGNFELLRANATNDQIREYDYASWDLTRRIKFTRNMSTQECELILTEGSWNPYASPTIPRSIKTKCDEASL